jgi:hypothetical protein
LLSRGDLEGFLDRIAKAAHPTSVLAARSPVPRRSLRELVQTDSIPASLETMPGNLKFDNSRLSIDFASKAELAGSLLGLAQILSDPDLFAEFEQRYVPAQPTSTQPDDCRAEVRELFAD